MAYYYYTYNYARLGWIALVFVFAIIVCILRARRNAARLAAAQSTVQVVMTPVDANNPGYPQMQEPGYSYYQPPAPAYTPGTTGAPYPPPTSPYQPPNQVYPGSPYQAAAQPEYPPMPSPYKPPATYPPLNDQQQQWQQQQMNLQQQQQQQQAPFQYSPSHSPALQPAPPLPSQEPASHSAPVTAMPAQNTSLSAPGMFSPPPLYTASHPSLQPAPPVEKPLEHQAYPMPIDYSAGGSSSAAGTASTQQQQQQPPRPAQAPQGLQ
ncbi:hypothetical protein EMPS_04205 [Entomortierella parvispora]|uniref:Uncharacterized protein n=1 Tax=Entomortierella parvispora TaxID=205924 RepID=A0A9P3H8N6_9FUNG|nr:hypothetical protein EMPS_04205 [Entomortierella parvispora]